MLPPTAKDPTTKTLPPDMRKSSFELLVMDVQRLPKHYRLLLLALFAPQEVDVKSLLS